MDAMEKELYGRYGSSIVPAHETRAALGRACELRLIEREDVRDLDSMPASSILKYISAARRRFLYNESTITFGNEDHSYQRADQLDPKEDPHFIDKTLNAYFEYAKMAEMPVKRGNSGVFAALLVLLLFLLFAYFSYTPRPY